MKYNINLPFLLHLVQVASIGYMIFRRQHDDITLTCIYGITINSKARKGAWENRKISFEKHLRRKWYKGSRDLDSNREQYVIQDLQPSDSGNYSCRVDNTEKLHKDLITYQLIVLGIKPKESNSTSFYKITVYTSHWYQKADMYFTFE